MALLDFLKKKDDAKKAKKPEKILDTKEVKETKDDEKKPSVIKTQAAGKKGFSYNVVKEPHISEKSTNLSQENKYVFKVYSNTSKPEIKKSVQGIYGVDVIAVNIIKIPKKKRRLGRTEGFKKGFIKAIVTLKEGQKIEVY